jgi:3-polyprenyl-4-hydroxybenzoate decarboxylase
MSTRMRADRDVMIASGFPGYYTDPTASKDSTVAKIGYDATMLPEQREDFEFRRAAGFKSSKAPARYQTVRQALEAGPLFFAQLMAAVGSKDGREIALALDALREEGILSRLKNGEWTLKEPEKKQWSDGNSRRRCERSEAIQGRALFPGLLRRFTPRNDGDEKRLIQTQERA